MKAGTARVPPLNVVAVLYGWSIRRGARRQRSTPSQVERLMGQSDRGRPRIRLAVPFALALNTLEILLAAVLPCVVLLLAARSLLDGSAVLARILALVGSLLGMFPVALIVVLGIWSRLPERRPGGFLEHPGRLWVPSILTLATTAFLGLLMWDVYWSPGP